MSPIRESTPFDELIIELQGRSMASSELAQPSELLHLRVMASVCRTVFIQMKEASDALWADYKPSSTPQPAQSRVLSQEEVFELSHQPNCVRLAYFSFLDEVNRFGRIIADKTGSHPPLYRRVKFFRDKMIEHWDDYFTGSSAPTGLAGTMGKIWPAYHFGSITKPGNGVHDRARIIAEFNTLGVDVALSEKEWYGEYSSTIFSALEALPNDYGARSFSMSPLIQSIYAYSFPTPICNVEEYCEELVAWMRGL
jgi:hypothetical protein